MLANLLLLNDKIERCEIVKLCEIDDIVHEIGETEKNIFKSV
jgi:hypothetical protein